MLGDVAKWLRFFGLRVHYRQWKDEELLSAPLLLTADRELCQRAEHCHLIRGKTKAERVAEALCLLQWEPKVAYHCMLCGSPLERIPSATAPVPEKVKAHHREVFHCQRCGKHYWKGSHWRNITAFVKEVRALWERCRKGKGL